VLFRSAYACGCAEEDLEPATAGIPLPLFHTRQQGIGIGADFSDPWDSLVVVVETGTEKLGIMIDDLVGQQQIVIKSLEKHLTRSRALSGAAILGDGKVALIIDVHGMAGEIAR